MRRVVIAGMVANGLEWYDFALYGYFVTIIGKLFFPGGNHYVQMLSTYGVFAAGFLMRPLGAIIFGYLGDKFGRKFSLTLSIFMMAILTASIAFLPTYAYIGIWAPILLTLIRLLQGLALAGQFSGSMAFIVEHSPIGRRGIAGSTTILSLCVGMLMGSLSATVFSFFMTQAEFELWGWRVPFVLGLVVAFVGFYIRNHTDESPHYEKAKNEGRLSQTPVREALRGHFVELLRGIGIYLSVTVPFYTLTVFLNDYMISGLGLLFKQAYFISALCMILMIIVAPLSAYISDKIGRKRLLVGTAIAYLIATVPIFLLMNNSSFGYVITAMLLFTVILSCYGGTIPALLVELFPTSIRYTGMALSYNIAAMLGGLTPVIETWLVKETQMNSIVALFIMLCACISLIAFIGYHDRYKEELL